MSHATDRWSTFVLKTTKNSNANTDQTLSDATTTTTTTSSSSCDHSEWITSSTAIILNMNARHVSPELIRIATEIVGGGNVFVTETAEEAMLAARTVVRGTTVSSTSDPAKAGEEKMRQYSLVVPVGGDGTLSGWINAMVDEIMLLDYLTNDSTRKNMTVNDAVKQLPFIGYIPMGTGNGLGYVVGCKSTSKTMNHEHPMKTLYSKILNFLTLGRNRKLQHARTVMRRLKEVGDRMQQLQDEQRNPKSETLRNHLGTMVSVIEMPMMEVTHRSESIIVGESDKKGDLCFFAGAGFDSLMLHDFQQIKAWSQSSKRAPTFVKNALSSVAGYCVALITKTLPQTLKYGTHKIHVQVVTKDEGTLWVDHRRGDFSELAVRPSTCNQANDPTASVSSADHLIYSGTTGIIAASTTPYYGGGLRLFPYARIIPDKLHMRIGRISPWTGFLNIPKIFEGSFREKSERSFGCLDFIGREFEVELRSERYADYIKNKLRKRRKGQSLSPWRRLGRIRSVELDDIEEDNEELMSGGFPFQHSGESMGCKNRFQIRMVQEPIKFISFMEPRVIIDK